MGVISPQCREAATQKLLNNKIDEHPGWKGEKAGYRAKHYRIVSLYGKAVHCENTKCTHKDYHRFEWACLDGEYTTDRSSWAMLCVFCHRQLDKQKLIPVLA